MSAWSWCTDEVEELFGGLTGDAWDATLEAAQASVDRWAAYDDERRQRRAVDPAFREHERQRWQRANRRRAERRRAARADRDRAAEGA